MINSILIGKQIKTILSGNQSLNTLVKGHISPIITYNKAKMETNTGYTEYPFIVYKRESIVTEYCKDGAIEDTVNMSILCVSDEYVESLTVANYVREALECQHFRTEEMTISECRLTGAQEDYVYDAYTQLLSFQFKIN